MLSVQLLSLLCLLSMYAELLPTHSVSMLAMLAWLISFFSFVLQRLVSSRSRLQPEATLVTGLSISASVLLYICAIHQGMN